MQENDNLITNHVENIKQEAEFLKKKGYSVEKIGEYTMDYSCKDCCKIGIYYGRYTDMPEVSVRFENKSLKPEQYSLGWFRNMKRFEAGEKDIFKKDGEKVDKLTAIFSLLKYLEDNFEDVTDIDFCRKTEKKINQNFEKGLWGIGK